MKVFAQRGRGRSIAGCLAAFALIALALFIPSMAQAAIPANDDIAAATTIGSLPFNDTLDTTEATTAADDPICAGNGHTVWYTFTPSADIRLNANTFGSSYDTTISVYTGSPGALTRIACNDDASGGLQSQVVFDTTGGQTLYIMAGSFGDFPNSGGSLTLTLAEVPPAQCGDRLDNDGDGATDYPADLGCDSTLDNDETDPPPPPQMSVSLNTSGSVDTSGVASFSGTVTCNQPAFVSLYGSLTQTFARRFIQGNGSSGVSCTPPSVPWTMTVSGSNGNRFSAGPARASIDAYGCNNNGCASDNASADVSLRGQRGQ